MAFGSQSVASTVMHSWSWLQGVGVQSVHAQHAAGRLHHNMNKSTAG